MNNKVKNHSVISPPPPPRVQVGDSRLLLRLFLAVILFISFSRCGGGGDTPEPTSQPDTHAANSNTPNPVVKSKEASISKLSFMVNGKNYDATISEGEVTVNLPNGTTIPSEVTITTLEHAPKADPSVSQGGTLTVSNGKAIITITAEDETTTKTYTINFVILPSSEAFISSLVLEVKGEAKTIDFDQDGNAQIDFPYGATIPSQVTITTLEYAPKAVSSVPQGETLTVSNGKATITITAEDDTTTKTYTINFVILPSSEAFISSLVLEVKGEAKTIDFDQDGNAQIDFPYGATIPSQVTITTLEYAPKAVSSVQQGEILTVSNGKATITITAEDETTTKTYTINFVREVRVTFNVNDDITAIPSLDLKKGSKASKPATDPMPASGKSFGYWTAVMGSTPANYGKDLFDFETTPINEDITLYAVWQEKPETKGTLIALINQAINDQGNSPNLNFIDTGLITDMKELFRDKGSFNGDVSGWDTSKVTTMEAMFELAYVFNGDVSGWRLPLWRVCSNMHGFLTGISAIGTQVRSPLWKLCSMKQGFLTGISAIGIPLMLLICLGCSLMQELLTKISGIGIPKRLSTCLGCSIMQVILTRISGIGIRLRLLIWRKCSNLQVILIKISAGGLWLKSLVIQIFLKIVGYERNINLLVSERMTGIK